MYDVWGQHSLQHMMDFARFCWLSEIVHSYQTALGSREDGERLSGMVSSWASFHASGIKKRGKRTILRSWGPGQILSLEFYWIVFRRQEVSSESHRTCTLTYCTGSPNIHFIDPKKPCKRITKDHFHKPHEGFSGRARPTNERRARPSFPPTTPDRQDAPRDHLPDLWRWSDLGGSNGEGRTEETERRRTKAGEDPRAIFGDDSIGCSFWTWAQEHQGLEEGIRWRRHNVSCTLFLILYNSPKYMAIP